jgi:hypothetical protein
MAELLQVHPSTYRSWEDGIHRPRPLHIRALCRHLGVQEFELGYTTTLPRGTDQPDARTATDLPPAVRRSQEHWLEVRHYLAHHGSDLLPHAVDLYPDLPFFETGHAFTHPDWAMSAPVDIGQVRLTLLPDARPPTINGSEPEAQLSLPLHSLGHRYDRYSTAIRYLDRPRLFENRHSYRLLAVAREGSRTSLDFGIATYFDKVDISETLVHEFASAYIDRSHRHLSPPPSWEDLPFRTLIGSPFDLSRRPVLPGVITLTLRRSPATSPSMLLHLRDPSRVAIGGRVPTLIPSGEFQPSTIAASSYESDLDLWRNVVREYSEELLGTPEHDGSQGSPLDYERWPLFRMLTEARDRGHVRLLFLGIACNPLSLGTDVLTVAVFDDTTFDLAFQSLRRFNSEGSILGHDPRRSTPGLAFDQGTVDRLLRDHQLAPSSAACLALAWRHRDEILA